MNLYEFLEQTARNNNRPWFAAHKDEYDRLREQWLNGLQRMLDCMAATVPGMTHLTARQAAYRFYRDTRFSPDKSPFKCYFSAAAGPGPRSAILAGYYLQIDSRPEENGLYAGLWCPDSAMLRKLRHAIVDNIEEFEEIMSQPDFARDWGSDWVGERLKTAPQGWPKDHPQIELLRLKHYGKFHPCTRAFFESASWPERCAELFAIAAPLVEFLNYSITEE